MKVFCNFLLATMIAIASENIRAKYLLVEIDNLGDDGKLEQENISKNFLNVKNVRDVSSRDICDSTCCCDACRNDPICSQFPSKNLKAREDTKDRYVYGNYVYLGDFPIPIDLSPQEKEKCKNQDLKSSGKFFVKRNTENPLLSRFQAVAEKESKTVISFAESEGKGKCDNVKTTDNYQGCGLAKYVVATCFQDVSVIGTDKVGIDVTNDYYWKPKERQKQRDKASKFCQTITFLRCAPYNGAPDAACVSYLRAGSISEFDLLFTSTKIEYPPKKNKPFKVFELGTKLEEKFKSKTKKFLEKNGLIWFFCKCKENEEKNCKKMISNK